MLPPKYQTELVNLVFKEFITRFKHFFNSCEQGFRNEFIIWLYTRVYRPNGVIQDFGREAEQVVLVTKGYVDLYTKDGLHFMRLPEGSVFLDYQLIFQLKSDIVFRAYQPELTQMSKEALNDKKWDQTETMCLAPEEFERLIDLYPETAKNIRLRGLEKRAIFHYYMRKAKMKSATHAKRRNSQLKLQLTGNHKLPPASTYTGPMSDSDHDEYHITKPFEASEENMDEALNNFSTDEEYEPEAEAVNEQINSVVACTYDLVNTMQTTIQKMSLAMRGNGPINFRFSDTLKRGILNAHADCEVFASDWRPAPDSEIRRSQAQESVREVSRELSESPDLTGSVGNQSANRENKGNKTQQMYQNGEIELNDLLVKTKQ